MNEFQVEQRSVARYGWKPSLPDPRDLVADDSGLAIAREIDPRGDMPPIYDQGNLGSCTSNAVGAAIEYDRILDGASYGTPSRLWIYWGERYLEGSLDQGDTGAYGRDGFKWSHRVGAPPETEWPYDISTYRTPSESIFDNVEPASEEYLLTKDYRAVRRYTTAFRRVLSNRQTIAFGFAVFESFEDRSVDVSGVVPLPDPTSEAMLGGHEVLAIGYLSDYPEHVLCRNSWGSGWGLDGYFLMPWAYLLDPSLASDFRTIRRPIGT